MWSSAAESMLVTGRRATGVIRKARAVAPEITGKKRGTPEAFFSPQATGEPPVLVYHLRKTGGSSLEQFVRENVMRAAGEVETLRERISKRADPLENIRAYRDWYRGLDAERRARLRCVMGRTAGFLLPNLDRSAETLTLVREPVDRVLSSHFDYKQRQPRTRDPLALLEEIYVSAADLDTGSTTAWEYFNGQSRQLLSVFYDVQSLPLSAGPHAGAALWRERLHDLVERVYFVGIQERFVDFVAEVAGRHDWVPMIFERKRNNDRIDVADLPEQLEETIRVHNWLDGELHELCRFVQARRQTL